MRGAGYLKQKLQRITNLNIMKNSETNNIHSHSRNTVLCDGFLIPMTDFVNNIGNMENYPSHEKALSWIYNYATFLKQPLKLEMFVPCDEMTEVMNYEEIKQSVIEGTDEKAKEKVLFELNSPGAVETMNYHISLNRNIEYLANFGSIKLTQNSLNAIFG